MEARRHEGPGLSPWPVRAGVYAALVLLAAASIWVIDRRAMVIQAEHGWTASSPPLPAEGAASSRRERVP